MKFRIEGSHRSGVGIEPFVIDAPSKEDAQSEAESRGIHVRSIKPLAAPTPETNDPSGTPKIVSLARHVYKMVQVPANIDVQQKEHKGNEAAAYLESVVNQYARQGWDFYRVDTLGVKLLPGCLGALLGYKEQMIQYYVITLRRPQSGA